MEKIWETNHRKLTLNVTLICKGSCKFNVVAYGPTPNSYYAKRQIEVVNNRTIEIKMPISPSRLKIVAEMVSNGGGSGDFIMNIEEKELVTYNIYMDQMIKEFLDFYLPFCQQAGFLESYPGGKIYQSANGIFKIRLLPVIKDFRGQVLNTPARIGHETGIIEVSQFKYQQYTIPAKVIIGLHEFCHKYRNPKIGLPISHEKGADVNGLYYYLGLGFSKVDAIKVFANVFFKADSQGNMERIRKIQDYIVRFENEEYAQKN